MGERLYRTTGIIIRRMDVGEADRLITVLTPEGKLTATARGVRKTASKLAGHLELLSECQLQLARGRSRDVITQSMALSRFEPVHNALLTMAAGYYVAELADAMVADEETAPGAYTCLKQTLQHLPTAPTVDMVLHWYTLQLCDAAGYRPQLVTCVVCGQMLTEAAERWSVRQGGMLCNDCRRMDSQAQLIELAVFKVLRFTQRESLAVVMTIKQPPEVHDRVFALLRQWVMQQSERRLRSATFLDDVRRAQS
jgi:DNA repair protein RecO (recombination protein O)